MYPNAESSPPRNPATTKLTATTNAVYFIVCFFVGQLTFKSSSLASWINWIILFIRSKRCRRSKRSRRFITSFVLITI